MFAGWIWLIFRIPLPESIRLNKLLSIYDIQKQKDNVAFKYKPKDASICEGIFCMPTSNRSCTEFIFSASDWLDTNVIANPLVPNRPARPTWNYSHIMHDVSDHLVREYTSILNSIKFKLFNIWLKFCQINSTLCRYVSESSGVS